MSLFTSKMRLLSAIVLEEKTEAVTASLLSLGLLDFVEVSGVFDTGEFNLTSTDPAYSSEIREFRQKLETLYRQAGVESPFRETLSVDQMTKLDLEASAKYIDGIIGGIETIRERQKKYHQEKLKLDEIRNYLV